MSAPEPPPGRVFVLAGPSGVGKGTVVAALRERYPQLWVSVSATPRAPRPRERAGVHYAFLTDAEFDDLVAADGLLEWAQVHGQARYGTPSAPVLAAAAQGQTVLLEIDLQGARQVQESLPQAYTIFLMPPSWEELVRRLTTRGTESATERERRLATARAEMLAFDDFDAVVVNSDLDTTVRELARILGLVQPVG